jgi:hypothetical protein
MDEILKKYLEKKSQEVAQEFLRNIEIDFGITLFKNSIERILYIELLTEKNKYDITVDLFDFYIQPQYKIKTSTEKYYIVDFLVYYTPDDYWDICEEGAPEFHKDHALIVEILSSNNQEELEAQIKKERELIKDGWQIIRFTDTEVINNPKQCAREIIGYFLNSDIIQKEAHEMMQVKINLINQYRKEHTKK